MARALLRMVIVGSLCLLAAWSVPGGGQLTFSGVVLVLVACCGCFARSERLGWYVIGAVLVTASLVLGVVDGPLIDREITGHCNSVFEPELPVVDDAAPGIYERCEEARRQHVPMVAGYGMAGLVALGLSLRRPRREQLEGTEDTPASRLR